MNQDSPNIKLNIPPSKELPNEIIDNILYFVFQGSTQGELSSTNSTYEEFTPFFDSQAFEDVDQEEVRLTLCNDMLGDSVYAFLCIQLENNVRYALGKVLRDLEDNGRRRDEIVEKILETARKRRSRK